MTIMEKNTTACRHLYQYGNPAGTSPLGTIPTDWSRTNEGWITGRIVDETGNPVACAHVRIYLGHFESISDTSGFFLLASIPTGEYMVMVDHECFGIQFIPHVRVGNGGTSLETIRMEERIISPLEGGEYREYLE
jgi:hypothetical protein